MTTDLFDYYVTLGLNIVFALVVIIAILNESRLAIKKWRKK